MVFPLTDYLQGNYHRRTVSPYQEPHRPKDRICPIALAVASFIVIIVVLTVAGLALYMGALHSEFPSPLVTFSCSIKVLRGDRFVGALQDKARRYGVQLKTLYKRSVLGPALVECTVDKFGEDTYTIFFTLTFERKRLPRSSTSLEKLIGDAIIADLISKKPIFKNIRFASGSLRIQEISQAVPHSTKIATHNETRKKSGVVLKTPVLKNISLAIGTNPKKKSSMETKKASSVQGSFKISKTEADITEKQDITTSKTIRLKVTTQGPKLTPPTKLNKITPTEDMRTTDKINKTILETSSITPRTLKITTTPPQPEFINLRLSTENSVTEETHLPFNSDIFDKEPWLPLYVNHSENTGRIPNYNELKTKVDPNEDVEHPIYTSFTNPSLTIFQEKTNSLGVTNLKGHPIPVNKIVGMTEPNNVSSSYSHEPPPVIPKRKSPITEQQPFGVDAKPTYISNAMIPKRHDKIKNISAIFHDLVSFIGNYDIKKVSQPPPKGEIGVNHDMVDDNEDINFGQGQVEVVESDEETLMKATTKIPLVTLLPVKSNSGIGKPLRRRPFRRNSTELDENRRSFGDITPLGNIDIQAEATGKMANSPSEDFKIISMLNFAPEIDDSFTSEQMRKAKMESSTNQLPTEEQFEGELIDHTFNLTKTEGYQPNLLTPEKIKLLSVISKINNMNGSQNAQESVISTKAVRPVYNVNNFGFKILSKYLNRVLVDMKQEPNNHTIQNCSKDHFVCGDGKCLIKSVRCNHLKECSDGSDEKNCTCADYLRSQYLSKKICDGIIDCWDFSDENNCEWCHPGQYICSNSKACVDKNKICDGVKDCLEGDDERQCVGIGQDLKDAEKCLYHNEGYLMIRKFGEWGKLCTDNLKNVSGENTTVSLNNISQLGRQFCSALTYRNVSSVHTLVEENNKDEDRFYELVNIAKKDNESSWMFSDSTCPQKNIMRISCESLECGFRPRIVRYRARIVGGKNAGMGSWPWQAALYKEGEFQCGGSLISDKWLISAGHCFYKSQDEYWVARLGALRRSTALPTPYEQIHPVQKIFIHPEYENNGFVNDIALLKLKKSVTFSDYVRPVCLPKEGESLEDEVQCTILGWGQLSEVGRIFPDTLQEVQVPVISTEECKKRTIFLPLYNITEEMFCAGYDRGGRDACLGDSGGPFICPEENGRWVIHGITSNGYGCARANRPGVYTKVSSYMKWIEGFLNLEDSNPITTAIEKKDNRCSGYRCPLGQCLPHSQVCNGFTECSDGSDEIDC
ncbi:serine protease nudel-like isoform X2 [Coccinella septempunctata]|uniref:serine protease nudel-like isoform X2 n=1 Tax=Coccinella septempunctata TaxID=41139 RepID=UPI001D0620A0|nr:serine protease nudel-like isoform X2 [Coccinella septempunctata]